MFDDKHVTYLTVAVKGRKRVLSVRWRDIIVNHLKTRQQGVCANCGLPITASYQERVTYITDPRIDGPEELDNLKLVHKDCSMVTSEHPKILRGKAIILLEKGWSPERIAKHLGLSIRTIYRYKRNKRL
jgi:hypothetical protein